MAQSNSPSQEIVPAEALVGPGYGRTETNLAPPILLQYWQIALRWKWVILAIIALSLIAGLVVTMLITPKYTATARIEISRDQKNITNVQGLESAQTGRDLEFYQTQYSLLSARSLAERVARQLGLATNDAFFEANGVKFDGQQGGITGSARNPEVRRQREEMAVSLLLGNITISPVRGSSLVDIRYTSASPAISAQIANAWTQQFIEASMARRFASTADARKFLEERLADLRVRLEASERDVVNYASERDIVALGSGKAEDGSTEVNRTLVSANLEALNAALTRATADRIAAESRAASKSVSNAETIANQSIGQLRQRRAELAAEYAKLMVQFEPSYPPARALSEQVKALDAAIGREEARMRTGASGEYQEAVNRENELRRQVETLKTRLDGQQRDSIQYKIYQREADTNRQLYESLLQRYKEIGVAGIAANNIAIVDAAQVPGAPSSPRLFANLGLALLMGLGLAVLATLALEQIDEGLRDPDQVQRLLGIPLLGSSPDTKEDTLTELADPKSALSESYLTVLSNLAFSTDHGVPRAFMVTSSRPGEGKSTTSLAIATMLARTGKKVLLIDADMRSPSIHQLTTATNVNGLSNYLAGENDWRRLVQPVSDRKMNIMSAGPMPPSASELLSNDRMPMLIRDLLAEFDHVVVDAPPILGLADAPLLARAMEGCVFVIEAEGVAVRGINASLDRLRLVHAHIFGAVLTKLKRHHVGYGYGYGYGYGDEANAA